MFLSNPADDPEFKEQDFDFTSLPLNEALQVSDIVRYSHKWRYINSSFYKILVFYALEWESGYTVDGQKQLQ